MDPDTWPSTGRIFAIEGRSSSVAILAHVLHNAGLTVMYSDTGGTAFSRQVFLQTQPPINPQHANLSGELSLLMVSSPCLPLPESPRGGGPEILSVVELSGTSGLHAGQWAQDRGADVGASSTPGLDTHLPLSECTLRTPALTEGVHHVPSPGERLRQELNAESGDTVAGLTPDADSSTQPTGFSQGRGDEWADLPLRSIVRRQRELLERDLLARTLDRSDGNKMLAAKLLSISYKTLLRKLKNYRIAR